MNNNNTTTNKSFEYKAKTIGRTPADSYTLQTEVVVSLKCLSNFWRSLELFCMFLSCHALVSKWIHTL